MDARLNSVCNKLCIAAMGPGPSLGSSAGVRPFRIYEARGLLAEGSLGIGRMDGWWVILQHRCGVACDGESGINTEDVENLSEVVVLMKRTPVEWNRSMASSFTVRNALGGFVSCAGTAWNERGNLVFGAET